MERATHAGTALECPERWSRDGRSGARSATQPPMSIFAAGKVRSWAAFSPYGYTGCRAVNDIDSIQAVDTQPGNARVGRCRTRLHCHEKDLVIEGDRVRQDFFIRRQRQHPAATTRRYYLAVLTGNLRQLGFRDYRIAVVRRLREAVENIRIPYRVKPIDVTDLQRMRAITTAEADCHVATVLALVGEDRHVGRRVETPCISDRRRRKSFGAEACDNATSYKSGRSRGTKAHFSSPVSASMSQSGHHRWLQRQTTMSALPSVLP